MLRFKKILLISLICPFEKAYKPTKLGNWEVPKWHLNRPKGRSTVTKVIVNDKGHLLPGVHKVDQKHWAGLYLGTYQLPKRITKEIAKELTNPKCQTWMKRSYHHPFIDRRQQNKEENNKLESINAREQSITNEEIDRESIKSTKSTVITAVGVRTSERMRSDSAVGSTRPHDGDDRVSGDGKRAAGGGDDTTEAATGMRTPSSPALSRISASDRRDDGGGDSDAAIAERPRGSGGSRQYGNAHRHHRLPDAIEDAMYRSLQMKRNRHPGLGLNGCWPKCSAVAYKSFNDPGPTQCSKLRVYRPKTSEQEGDKKKGSRAGGNNSRPNTCVPVVTARQLTDIKLALCWDLDAPFDRNRPPPPPDEPAVFQKVQQPCNGGESRKPAAAQPYTQNSSAVMGFVQTAAKNGSGGGDGGDYDEDALEARRALQARECQLKNRNLSAVMELIPNKARANDDRGPADDGTARSLSNKSSSSVRCKSGSDGDCGNNDSKLNGGGDDDDSNERRERGDYNFADDPRPRPRRRSAGCTSDRRRRHQSQDAATAAVEKETTRGAAAAQTRVYRPCAACDNPNAVAAANRKAIDHDECNHYKMAFKAGVPVSTPVKNRTTAAGKPARHLKVPKPRTTNSDKKKYVIGTLLPPFSMWPGTTARDYPEHWRLTSVYRQAFKPLELRKQPLLQTVYL